MASNKPSGITRDYGRRSYIETDPEPYMDHMKRVTDFQKYQEALERHSEWKRPYISDDYEQMEYWWSPPFLMNPKWWMPYWLPDGPTIGHPDIFDPVADCTHCAITCHGGYNCGWGWCHKSVACWLPGQNISRDFSWAIISGGEYLSEVEYDKPLSGSIRFKTTDALSGGEKVTIEVRFTDGMGHICTDTASLRCEEEEEDCCSPSPPSFTWDSSSDDTILKNDSASVTVSGGCSPFSWQITGTGFSLGAAQTTGRSNSVNTDGTACGSASITVTDFCGSVTNGSVRCTEAGSWVTKTGGSCFACASPWTSLCNRTACGSCAGTLWIYSGKDRWVIMRSVEYHTTDPGCPPVWSNSFPCDGSACNHQPPCGPPGSCGAGSECGTDRKCSSSQSIAQEWKC